MRVVPGYNPFLAEVEHCLSSCQHYIWSRLVMGYYGSHVLRYIEWVELRKKGMILFQIYIEIVIIS